MLPLVLAPAVQLTTGISTSSAPRGGGANCRGRLQHPAMSWPIVGNTFKKKYTCNLCSYSTDYPTNIQRHMLTHTGERPFRCDTCGKGFTTKQNLESHKLQHTRSTWFPM
ncbi:hypothetical protein MRX96_033318 [Rhipicephalus microplus]|uniref:C2H2-type domain-containing protein n=1 Tax=Rhipicephalus microplus TaxID=6941 RepID=A0A9J6DW62_RHIMP|nr:hypothetical protein HPB51_017808 [Rhipicephalus microplus]